MARAALVPIWSHRLSFDLAVSTWLSLRVGLSFGGSSQPTIDVRSAEGRTIART